MECEGNQCAGFHSEFDKEPIFWKVTRCRQVSTSSYRRFGERCLHLHSKVVDRMQHTRTGTSSTHLWETSCSVESR